MTGPTVPESKTNLDLPNKLPNIVYGEAKMPVYIVKGREVILDKKDALLLDALSWSWSNGYLITKIPVGKGKRRCIGIHRIIMDDPEDDCIDHINRNRADNRRCNLRPCTYRENQLNVGLVDKPGKGVSFHRGKWQVVVRGDGKIKWLGYHETEEKANEIAKAYFDSLPKDPIIRTANAPRQKRWPKK